MRRFILELLSYLSFVCVLYVVSYSNHNSDAHRQVNHLSQLLLNPYNFTDNFSQVGRFSYKKKRESFDTLRS